MLNSLKTMLGLSLLALIGVWMGCSSNTSPVASYSANKTAAEQRDGLIWGKKIPIDVPDANLASVLRTARGLDPTATISNFDLQHRQLTKLDAEGQGIQNLRGIEYAYYLDTLNLADNSITDISPLRAFLWRLEYLNLSTNEIADISPLRVPAWAGATYLTYLNLADNSITDIDSLASLTKLEYLNLADNSITDISPLADLDSLTTLNLSSNSITDLSDLAGLTNLTTLYLSSNSITDLSDLASLTKLKRLAIGENSLRGDLSDLADLTELEWLMINSAGVTDLSPLEGLTKLKYLDVSSSPGLTYFSPLTCLLPDKGALKTLVLRGMPLFRVVDGKNVPKQDRPDLLYLASKGVTITF